MHIKPTIPMFVGMFVAALWNVSEPALAAPVFLGPTPYLSVADSPFNGAPYSYFFLENLEDGSFNTLGATVSGATVTSPGSLTDSVDADDGTIDGSGTAGHSLISTGHTISFAFDAGLLGGLPTDVGIVWTDVGQVSSTFGFGGVVFEAFDSGGTSLGSIGPFTLGDGAITGGTAEDRFFGVMNAGGISRIDITMANSTDWEVDHLQYGSAFAPVPEPSTLALLAAGLPALWAMRRRRQ